MTAWLWFIVVCLGAAALGAFLFYGEKKTEEPESPALRQQREAATRELYEDNDTSE